MDGAPDLGRAGEGGAVDGRVDEGLARLVAAADEVERSRRQARLDQQRTKIEAVSAAPALGLYTTVSPAISAAAIG